MRVLHVYSGNLFGGIETILVSVARHAAGDVAHEFALCFEGRLSEELRAAGAAVHALTPVRVSRPHSVRQARRRLAALLASGSWDAAIVHAPWSHALFGPTIRRAGVPLVFWAHDAWTGRHWTERLARRTAPDLVVANSRFTASTLQAAYGGVPREVVYAPIDAAPPLAPDDRRSLRDELATPPSAVVVVQASRMESFKGHATLLRTLSSLRDDPRWWCWLVGGAQRDHERAYVASLRQLAADLGIADRVRFVGERADVRRLLAAGDICCQPNERPESFGMIFVEALTAGVPVVATALGGAVEIVDDSCGRLITAGDAGAWRTQLDRLIADAALRTQLGTAGPRRAMALCEPARQLRRLRDAIAAIVPAHANAPAAASTGP